MFISVRVWEVIRQVHVHKLAPAGGRGGEGRGSIVAVAACDWGIKKLPSAGFPLPIAREMACGIIPINKKWPACQKSLIYVFFLLFFWEWSSGESWGGGGWGDGRGRGSKRPEDGKQKEKKSNITFPIELPQLTLKDQNWNHITYLAWKVQIWDPIQRHTPVSPVSRYIRKCPTPQKRTQAET